MASEATFIADIPDLNGPIEGGIVTGIDLSLPLDQRIPIVEKWSLTGQAFYAAAWAKALKIDKVQISAPMRRLLIAGAYVAVGAQLCRRISTTTDLDGDFRPVSADSCGEFEKTTEADFSGQDVARAFSIMVATKANWWATNHHTGQGELQGYAKKIALAFFTKDEAELPATATIMRLLGHWVSTRYILTLAGIGDLLVTRAIASSPVSECLIKVAISTDAKLRFHSLPSGTHKMGVCFEAGKRLVESPLAIVCPGIEQFDVLPAVRDKVMARPAQYHTGAFYLTGRERAAYADTDYDGMIGRLGTFISVTAPASTLAKSPHFKPLSVESKMDFDRSWQNACTRYVIAASKPSASADSVFDIMTANIGFNDLEARANIWGTAVTSLQGRILMGISHEDDNQ